MNNQSSTFTSHILASLLILFTSSLINFSAIAQEKDTTVDISEQTIKGIVSDELGRPMPFVLISIQIGKDTLINSTTNFNGEYQLLIPKTYFNRITLLSYSFIYYKVYKVEYFIKQNKTKLMPPVQLIKE